MSETVIRGESPGSPRKWAVLCVFNLLLVSVLGILLRYKIAFSLPVVNYKFLVNAHSHFAFSGWANSVIFTALVYILSRSGRPISKSYAHLFWLNQVSGFGMLLSFPFEGYGQVSIFFSVLSILFSYWFTVLCWRDISKSGFPALVKMSAKSALIFLVLSSAGPFLLAYIMSHRITDYHFYYNAVYLFLHFQYNGWFSFAVIALFFYAAHDYAVQLDKKKSKLFFILMAAACIPAYCLSLLWTNPPLSIFIIAALAGCLQLAALFILGLLVWKSKKAWSESLSLPVKICWGLAFAAFAIKLILQALSAIPALGKLAFGYRPIIIGYLHLVMLGFISFFMLGFLIKQKLLQVGKKLGWAGLMLFITGVLANEVLLFLQGLLSVTGLNWPGVPLYLFGAAIVMFTGLSFILIFESRASIAIPGVKSEKHQHQRHAA